jgi:hypothetical protein
VSEERIVPDAAEFASTASKATVFWTNVFQSLLVAAVVLWVLDIPRQVFNIAFYTEQLLTICLGLTLALAYIADTSRRRHWSDWVAVVLSLALCGYIAARYATLTDEAALLPLSGLIVSGLLILLIMEASRRTNGWGFVSMIAAIAVYVYISPHLPGDFQTRYVSPERMTIYLGLDLNGAIGSILQVAVMVVIPFTILGQVLARTGGADFFSDISMAAMGRFRGGAAKIAVVGSGLFGMISGSAVSNVLAVGIVTIPTMVRSGFTPYRAAAIESVGSTGGQLMPPVMGAAAFIMAEFLQVPYGAVCIAAAIPAFLYYACLFFHVDLEAAKHRIGAAKIADAPHIADVLKSGWHFLVPIAFLVFALMYPDITLLTPEKAAIVSTAILMVLALIFGDHGDRAGFARHHPDRRGRRHHGRDHEHFGPCVQHDDSTTRAGRRQCLPAPAVDRGAGFRARHRPANGERLHPDGYSACAGARQARGDADGRAYVRHVQRHSFNDHAASCFCSLCRRQYRAHRWLDDWVDRVRGRLEHVYLAVPVRADTEPADGRQLDRDRAQFHPCSFRHLAWHNGCGWLCASAVGSRRAAAVCDSIDRSRAAAGKLPGCGLDQCRRHHRRDCPACTGLVPAQAGKA